jgi:hypothetical protein
MLEQGRLEAESPAVVEEGLASLSSTMEPQMSSPSSLQALPRSRETDGGGGRASRGRRRGAAGGAGDGSSSVRSRWSDGGAHSRMGRSGALAAGVGRDGARVGRGSAPVVEVGRDGARVGRDGDGRHIGRRPEWGG